MAGNREFEPVVLNVDVSGFDGIIDRLETSLTTIDKIAKVLKDHGRILQRRAVANVSGISRTFDGATWIINRVTGKLARSIQVNSVDALSITVVAGDASANYAGDVELGTRGPTDLKKTKLAGKIVPMPMTNKAAMSGLSAAKKLQVKSGPKTQIGNILIQNKIATTGRKMGMTSVRFLRVPGPGGKGWILPMRLPRPFMGEALAYTAPLLKAAVEAAYKAFLEEGD